MSEGSRVAAEASASWPRDDPRVDEILDIVAREAGVARDRLTPDASIASLDIASLDLVQAMFALESHFNVEIPVAAEPAATTVAGLVRQVLDATRNRSLA